MRKTLNLNKIKPKLPVQKLRELKVGLIYLFGSQAEGLAGPSSDIDIGIVFTDQKILQGDTSALYQGLYDIFSEVFDLRNFKNIDIVFLERTGLELKLDVILHGAVLFEISPDFRLNFEERALALYRDFIPVLQEFNRAVLERI